MTDSPTKASGKPDKGTAEVKKRGLFARIALFIREMVSELKKVVYPTRKELINYTAVVLGFVIVMMLIVTGLDFVFGKLAAFVFAGVPLW